MELGEAYMAGFGGMSHSIHGSWQDLLEYHLVDHDDGTFEPEFAWHPIRPQVLLALGVMTVDTITGYLAFMAQRASMEDLGPKLADLKQRLFIVNDAHEAFLSADN